MALLRLDIADFRNLASVKIEPISQGFNLIYGNNGSGKTSLLEAIYYLSLGRSFRSTTTQRMIKTEAEKFSLFSQISPQIDQVVPVGLERHINGETKIRMSGRDVKSNAELAQLTPVQLINSHCFNLLDAPIFRRKYLDWGAFYVSNDFFRIWKQYECALKQRNAALRNHLSKRELESWTRELIEYAIQLDKIRREYVDTLIPLLLSTMNELLTLQGIELTYYSGWNAKQHYQDVLIESLDRDRQLGYTQNGPHRADFKINVNRMPAKDILSRGQQKLFVCAMILAQGTLLYSYTNKKSIYLVDDLPAELDMTSRANLMSLLAKQEAQIFVTAVERETLEDLLDQHATRMFHVEHGEVKQCVDQIVE